MCTKFVAMPNSTSNNTNMNLQNVLKRIKLNENNISMALGVLILIVVGAIVVNYFRGQQQTDTLPSGVQTETAQTTLPTKHTVAGGETLWSIAEKYYKSGYNWVDIQKENNLANAGSIEVGQELTIPDVAAKTATVVEATESAVAQATSTPTPVITPTAAATVAPTATPTEVAETPTEGNKGSEAVVSNTQAIEGTTYTVARGDSLWDIAVRAYNDGYKWVEIAKANNLSHPGVIHAGNTLTLPR